MKKFRSIRWQLLVWQMVLLAGVLVTLLTLHYQLQKRDSIAQIDAELQEGLMTVMPVIFPVSVAGRPPPFGREPPPFGRTPSPRTLPEGSDSPIQRGIVFLEAAAANNIYVAVWGLDGVMHKRYGNVPGNRKPNVWLDESSQVMTRDGCRELIQGHRNKHLIVIGCPLTEVYANLAATRLYLILIGGVVLFIGFSVGWLITNRALLPIQKISDTAVAIAEGGHHQRIELSDAPDELAGLAATLNRTFDHLHDAIQTQQRFSADASHELRTPVAVVIAQTEAALKRDRTTDEYKNILNACLRAGQRMKKLANSLLELTHLDGAGEELEKVRCSLRDVLAGAVDSGMMLSEKHPVEFRSLEDEFEVKVDPVRTHQVVMNLLSNAIQHNPDGCALQVALEKIDADAVIKIVDDGVGISAESLPHIFERFYRADQSRSREHGGAGLGLSIVKRLVEAHDGTIAVASIPNQKTTFIIRLPLV